MINFVSCNKLTTIPNSNPDTLHLQGTNKGRGVKPINVQFAASTFASGISPTKIDSFQVSMGLVPLNRSTNYNLAQLVWTAADRVSEKSFESVAKYFQEHPDLSIIVAGDGAWAKRGWTSSQGVYVAIDFTTKKVIKVIVLEHERTYMKDGTTLVVRRTGSYGGTSGGMEIEGLRQVLSWLSQHKLLSRVTTWVTDKDSSVTEELATREDTKHIQIVYDPGHIKKSFKGQLMKLFGSGERYKKFPTRLSAFFMRLIKRSEAEHPKDPANMKKTFLQYWDSFIRMFLSFPLSFSFFNFLQHTIHRSYVSLLVLVPKKIRA